MTNNAEQERHSTRIMVFEHRGSGQEKIQGIREFGHDIEIIAVVNIEDPLPNFIDEPDDYINAIIDCDLVLCFIKHPDLVEHLAKICARQEIPLIASGVKCGKALTPFTCCGLGQHKNLGHYGRQFGLPELTVQTDGDTITTITVQRGASCGATWKASQNIIGLTPEEAFPTLAREVQYLCVANPSAFDPISGKSSLHYAGEVHIAALKKALSKR